MTLEAKTDELIAWCEANAADDRDLREALTAAAQRLGTRCDRARTDELAAFKAFIDVERAKGGKPPIVADAVAPAAAELEAEAIR